METNATTPLPMTVVMGKTEQETECLFSVEVWASQAVSMDNADGMRRLAEPFDRPKGPEAAGAGFQGVAFRSLVKRGNDWHLSEMTIPYYPKEGRVYETKVQGFTCAQDVMDYASGFVDYIQAQASKNPAYQGDEVRFEAIQVTSHILTLLSPAEGVAPTGFGFMGIAGLEPLSASSPTANPKLSRLTDLEVTEHGLPIGAYIRGAQGETIVVPKRIQSTMPADNLSDRLASRRSMGDSAKPSFPVLKTPKA